MKELLQLWAWTVIARIYNTINICRITDRSIAFDDVYPKLIAAYTIKQALSIEKATNTLRRDKDQNDVDIEPRASMTTCNGRDRMAEFLSPKSDMLEASTFRLARKGRAIKKAMIANMLGPSRAKPHVVDIKKDGG